MDNTQRFDIALDDIVPEYYSKNPHVKGLFYKRFDAALEYVHSIKPKRILDAGCGDGIFTNRLTGTGDSVDVVGVDFNTHVEELNKKYRGIRFMKADMRELPFPEGSYDCVTCLDVLEHFYDVEDVLAKIKKIIKKNGYLVVSGPVESFWYKLGRLLTKGSFSQETGPGAGKHYYNIIELDKIIKKQFVLVKKTKISFLFIHLFDVNLYQKP
jgi:2-polyprenyl-3-methyl-5-hydroxy-6-metoxy-1,4-benzoquinol methylase